MKVSVLIENSALEGLECEHGLSFFIEFNGKKYLLDAGQSGVFMENAAKMGTDVSESDYVILSHGHYDHAGGFGRFLKENSSMKVYAMRTAIEEYYSASGGMHQIGIPLSILTEFSDRFIFINEATYMDEGVYLIPHTAKGMEEIGSRAGLYHKVGENMMPDDFRHEMSVVFDTDKGLVIFNSCSHAGMYNIINEVKAFFPDKLIYTFIGGLHMKGMRDGMECCTFSENEISEMIRFLTDEGVKNVYTGHCTGNIGFQLMENACHGINLYKLTTGHKYNI